MALALCFYLCWYFYPRSPCGERHLFVSLNVAMVPVISIHALLAESDTIIFCKLFHGLVISIHALLAESDLSHAGRDGRGPNISIHALLAESDALIPDK